MPSVCDAEKQSRSTIKAMVLRLRVVSLRGRNDIARSNRFMPTTRIYARSVETRQRDGRPRVLGPRRKMAGRKQRVWLLDLAKKEYDK